MDPISAAIIGALAIGVAGGVKQIGEKVVVDAYESFKAVLRKKYGVDSDLIEAVEKLEKRPDSEARKSMLQEEVGAVNANHDEEVVTAAKTLLELIEAQSSGEQYTQTVTGSHNQAIQSKAGRDVTVNVNPSSPSRKTGSEKAKSLDQVSLELLREISNVASGYFTPVELENKFDAWQLAISPKLKKDIDLERVKKISDGIDRVVYNNDLSDFNPATMRSEIKKLTEIANRPPKAQFKVLG